MGATKRARADVKPAAPRGAAGATSKKGITVRNPQLEAVIERDPSQTEPYLVYADWLQQQGDPLGELIIIQHGLCTSEDPRAVTRFERDHTELFKKFRKELLGDNSRNAYLRHQSESFRTFSWRYGFIRAARFGPLDAARSEHALTQLLTHPAGRFVERLILGQVTSPIRSVLRKHAPQTLTWLAVGDCQVEASTLEGLGKSLPRLRRLHIVGHAHSPEPYEGRELEELRITLASYANQELLRRTVAPRLRSLRIELNTVLDLTNLASDLARFTALESLQIGRFVYYSQWRSADDELVLALASAAAARPLRHLRLDLAFTETCGRTLIARAHELSRIGSIELPRHALLGADYHDELTEALPMLRWSEPSSADELALPEMDITSEGPYTA